MTMLSRTPTFTPEAHAGAISASQPASRHESILTIPPASTIRRIDSKSLHGPLYIMSAAEKPQSRASLSSSGDTTSAISPARRISSRTAGSQFVFTE